MSLYIEDLTMRHIAKFILWISGWTVKGEIPADKKAVVISAPHTSVWDFIWGKLTFMSRGIPTYILMKKEFFFFPLGSILRALNVIPVDRGARDNGIVDAMVEEFKKHDVFYLTITPEGSRKKRRKWKKGFWMIAKAADVPIYLGRIDYKYKYCSWGQRFVPTEDLEADMKYIMSTYKDANPKHPELFSCGDI